jgi:hypothetical protein
MLPAPHELGTPESIARRPGMKMYPFAASNDHGFVPAVVFLPHSDAPVEQVPYSRCRKRKATT